MNGDQDCSDVRISLTPNRATASLTVPRDFPRDMLTETYCAHRLVDAGVEVTRSVAGEIIKLIASSPDINADCSFVVAQQTQPRRGADATLQWTVDNCQVKCPCAQEASEPLSHYDRCAYTMVKRDEIVGRITPPTHGRDGRDVTGRTLTAKSGKPIHLQLDKSIELRPDGALIACVDGVLRRAAGSACISPLLEVRSFVDFSTGHIDFDGDIIISGGVRDCFQVKATRNIEVCGMVEAASMHSGGNLIVRGGMAGRERGHVHVGGDLLGRYLDNVVGDVRGDLKIERELINCHLTVGGNAVMPRASIIGGRIAVTGSVEVCDLGSPAGVKTYLVLGTVPVLEDQLRTFKERIAELRIVCARLKAEQQQVNTNTKFLSAAQKERITELMFEYDQADRNMLEADTTRAAMQAEIDQRRKVDFAIVRRIHRGVRLTVGSRQFEIDKDVVGPVQVGLNLAGQPFYRRGRGEALPLTSIARPICEATDQACDMEAA